MVSAKYFRKRSIATLNPATSNCIRHDISVTDTITVNLVITTEGAEFWNQNHFEVVSSSIQLILLAGNRKDRRPSRLKI